MLRNQTFPNNWKACSVQEIFKPLPNLSFSRDQLTHKAQTLEYIHYGDIHTGCIDELISEDSILPYLVKEHVVKNIDKYLLCPGDIVLVDASEDYDGVTKSIEISNVGAKKIVAGLHTIPLRPLKGVFAPGFARYVFKHSIVSKTLKAIAQGTKVFSISFALIKKVILFCPPITEQQKIVEVLETWDKAIQLTRKLIEQKELQKKYLMQQLLTGRTRLKGFTGKWIPCKLKEICAIRKGEQLNATELKDQGEYPCLNGGIAPSGYTDNWNTEKNTISISEGGNSCGYVNWNPKRFWAGGHCYTLSDIKANPEFLYFLLKNKEKHIMNLRVGSGLPNIQRSSLENLSLSIPESKEEQSQIGRLLIGVDIGIEFAQKYLAKLEEQKKGLMQVLLTGKVRLAVKETK